MDERHPSAAVGVQREHQEFSRFQSVGTASAGRWQSLIVAFLLALLLAIALARIAVWLQMAGYSTILLFPAVFGATLGIGVSFIPRLAGDMNRSILIALVICSAAVMAAAEHGFYYTEYRHELVAKLASDEKAQLLASMLDHPPTPASFVTFIAAEAPAKWPLWIFDALTMIAVAGLAAWWMCRSAEIAMASLESDVR